MSCMVMSPEPLAALANAVEARLNCDYNYWGFGAPDSLYRELNDCKTSRTGATAATRNPLARRPRLLTGACTSFTAGQRTGSTALPLERGTTILQSSLTSGSTRPWRMRRTTIPSGLLWWSFSVPFTPSL